MGMIEFEIDAVVAHDETGKNMEPALQDVAALDLLGDRFAVVLEKQPTVVVVENCHPHTEDVAALVAWADQEHRKLPGMEWVEIPATAAS